MEDKTSIKELYSASQPQLRPGSYPVAHDSSLPGFGFRIGTPTPVESERVRQTGELLYFDETNDLSLEAEELEQIRTFDSLDQGLKEEVATPAVDVGVLATRHLAAKGARARRRQKNRRVGRKVGHRRSSYREQRTVYVGDFENIDLSPQLSYVSMPLETPKRKKSRRAANRKREGSRTAYRGRPETARLRHLVRLFNDKLRAQLTEGHDNHGQLVKIAASTRKLKERLNGSAPKLQGLDAVTSYGSWRV